MKLKRIVKLTNYIVHVRYSTKSPDVRFSPPRYTIQIDDVQKNILLWIESSMSYVAFDTQKVIDKIKPFGFHKKEDFFIKRTHDNEYIADNKVVVNDCILQEKNDELEGLFLIAKKYVAKGNLEGFVQDVAVKEYSEAQIKDATVYEIEIQNFNEHSYYVNRKKHEDITEKKITDSVIETTMKEQIVFARYGQGEFRDAVFDHCNNCCVLTGITTRQLLIASHIKPWRDSNNSERLDKHNGLLLAATYDKLFDQGLITFDENGVLKISPQLSTTDRKKLFPDENIQRDLSPETQEYLQHHRDKIFKGNKKP